jgi:hypothetical protein
VEPGRGIGPDEMPKELKRLAVMDRGCRMLSNAHAELDYRWAESRGGKATMVVCPSAVDVRYRKMFGAQWWCWQRCRGKQEQRPSATSSASTHHDKAAFATERRGRLGLQSPPLTGSLGMGNE